jgi:hypothetical protein
MGAFSVQPAIAVRAVVRGKIIALGCGLALCLAPGCASRHCCPLPAATSLADRQPEELPRHPGPAPPLTPDVSAVGSLADVDRSLPRPAPPDSHYPLTAREAQCRAASNAPLAELLVLEARLATSRQYASAWAAQLESELLLLRASDERNKAAAAALESFYRLAQAQNDRRNLEQTRAELDRNRQFLDELRKQGVKPPVDASAVDRQRLEWEEKRGALELLDRTLEGQLRQLIGLAAADSAALSPQADWRVAIESVNVDEAIAVGLRTRADLAILARLGETIDLETLGVARTGLRQTDSALGIPPLPTRSGIFGLRMEAGDATVEVAVRREQLAIANAQRTRQASDEIRLAVTTLDTRLREIAIARDVLENRRRRTSDLTAQRATGAANAFEISAARLDELAAESRLVDRITAWRIAQVNLRAAQGLLADECGFGVETARGNCIP